MLGCRGETNEGSFLWDWNHLSVQPVLQEHIKLVRDFSNKHKLEKITTKNAKITETETWEFVSVANWLESANGGYRADTDGPLVFMTFGEITL